MNITKPFLICIPVLAGLLLPGCDRVRVPGGADEVPEVRALAEAPGAEVPPEAPSGADGPARPGTRVGEAVIDWDSARLDMAASVPADGQVGFQIASGDAAPAVPIFLPSAPVGIQGGEAGVRFQPVADGYYAFFPGTDYDVIINGTNQVIEGPDEAVRMRTEEMVFQTTMTGAQVVFARYGADYLVEFECRALAAGQPSCIDREEALAFVAELVISGSR